MGAIAMSLDEFVEAWEPSYAKEFGVFRSGEKRTLEFISKTAGKKAGHTADIRKISRVDGSMNNS